MTDLPFDPIRLMREHPEKMCIPGGLLTKQGPQDYVGSVPAITGTLFFKDAHLPEVREAISAYFDEYGAIAKEHLTWLWREEPPEGPDKIAYAKAKPMPLVSVPGAQLMTTPPWSVLSPSTMKG